MDAGSFLVRFSSTFEGSYAVSYVHPDGNTKHALIHRNSKGMWKLSTEKEDVIVFDDVPELILFYKSMFNKPVGNGSSQVYVIGNKWREDVIELENIVGSLWKPNI
jgi:hypothetical protein